MCILTLSLTPYSKSLFASFMGQFLIALTISFGESGRGSVREAVICHCGNKWVDVFCSLKIIMEPLFLLTGTRHFGKLFVFLVYTLYNRKCFH